MTPEKEERIGRCLKCKHLKLVVDTEMFVNEEGYNCDAICKGEKNVPGKLLSTDAGWSIEDVTTTVIGYLSNRMSPIWCPLDYSPTEKESASINANIRKLTNEYFELLDKLKKIDNDIDELNNQYFLLNGTTAPEYDRGKNI